MNCPYCHKLIRGLTGLQEAQNFQKHLRRCRRNPNHNIVLSDGQRTVVTPMKPICEQNLLDAVKIRNESGQ
jgi:hypothetical protein